MRVKEERREGRKKGEREGGKVRGKEEGKDEAKGDGQKLTVTTSPAASSQFAIRVEPYLTNKTSTQKIRKEGGGSEQEGCVNSPES